MTDILKDLEALKAQLAAKQKEQENAELQKASAARRAIQERNERMEEFTFRVLALCAEYPDLCKESAPWLATKMRRAVEITAGRAKDFSGA